jgi:hypothetical protein
MVFIKGEKLKSKNLGIPLTQVLLYVVVLAAPVPPVLATPDYPNGSRKPLGCNRILCQARQSSSSARPAIQQVGPNCGSECPASSHYMLRNLSQGNTQISELGTGGRELFQRGQGVTQHGMPSKTAARLVECPESLDIVRIEFKKLLDEALGNFGGRQVHLVEGAEQRQQIEPRRFQAWAEVGWLFDGSARRHGPSMVHRGAEVKDAVGPGVG